MRVRSLQKSGCIYMSYKLKTNLFPYILLFFWIFQESLFSQDINTQFRLAREYEEAGRWKEARQLYESMLISEPDNESAFEGLKDLYIKTLSFTEAKSLIERQLSRHPDQIQLEVDLAMVIYCMGEPEHAFKHLDSILKEHNRLSTAYQAVADLYTSQRLYDRAIETYLLGRKNIGDEDLYAISLSRLYAAKQKYGEASDELLNHLKANPGQLNYIEDLYLDFPQSNSVLSQIEPSLKKALRSYPDQIHLYTLLSKVYEHYTQYEAAYDIIIALEARVPEREKGRALFSFAETIFSQGVLKIAKSAYLNLLTSYPHFNYRDRTLLGLANCYEAENNFRKAADTYQQVIDLVPQNQVSASALLRKGLIERDHLSETSESVRTFMVLKNSYRDFPESIIGELELASCYIILNDFDASREILNSIISRPITENPKLKVRAIYQLAQLYYYIGDIDHSLAWLDSLSLNKWYVSSFQHPIVNDGLRLRFFINQYRNFYPHQLNLLSRADLLTVQKKYQNAVVLIDSIVIESPSVAIQADAFFRLGEIYLLMDDKHRSMINFSRIYDHYPEHYLADLSLERCGYILELLGDKKEASLTYEKLLTNYPQSIFREEIRNRIRNIEQEKK
jgi:tetratricopeptide (TPR) repeat protein